VTGGKDRQALADSDDTDVLSFNDNETGRRKNAVMCSHCTM